YEGDMTFGGILIVFLLATALFLAAECVIAAKNMEAARSLEALSRRIKDIRSGNYEKTASGSIMPGDDGAAASNSSPASRPAGDLEDVLSQLEDIRQGMAAAVDEQMKSERMKVELIANVSHDIKTPLTSIISYVQFLKQEDELPEHVKDYVKILDEKSQRLKNMIQDVFAVSKAASGELPIQMEELDFGKLLRQTMADMEEQITESPLTFRTEIPQEPVMILADGQRMYRVFQNLLQNAIKYSLAGSRVYVTLTTDGSQACAAIKNTSQLEPEKGKDFAERFARGDQSRTDGGSGLGLSIAQSFTEACGGAFAWETNADLFIVTVSFRQVTS
ncbi:MAG: HAMP domain-containing histidine kinase, partial [Acetatifactor sp.]|nr:HAMP domain-containing histidine kinase [Acetatifactor sp.]